MAEFNICNRDRMAYKAWNIHYSALHRESLPTFDIEDISRDTLRIQRGSNIEWPSCAGEQWRWKRLTLVPSLPGYPHPHIAKERNGFSNYPQRQIRQISKCYYFMIGQEIPGFSQLLNKTLKTKWPKASKWMSKVKPRLCLPHTSLLEKYMNISRWHIFRIEKTKVLLNPEEQGSWKTQGQETLLLRNLPPYGRRKE